MAGYVIEGHFQKPPDYFLIGFLSAPCGVGGVPVPNIFTHRRISMHWIKEHHHRYLQ
ncbi:predicted protein [Plenodomus lingam JN3]|uniref:Predicted protein n=1 Tax=Leptosphaeria maculans (strain JN3 / isolate v23.1.3 / race Av1-4-5-6-7-8) TaxID=985895 RepID=E5AF74_LEPMJ|nr:predicted protein [Plenodomus lingam JN3]CBY01863.1 predicted protein [Plenodomus lingam JN3]